MSELRRAFARARRELRTALRRVPRKIIRARFGGKCPYCPRRWNEGDDVAWSRGNGSCCVACYQRVAA